MYPKNEEQARNTEFLVRPEKYFLINDFTVMLIYLLNFSHDIDFVIYNHQCHSYIATTIIRINNSIFSSFL